MVEKKELVAIEKIGIIMFGLLGDVLIRTPIINALKELYPHATITAICDANTKSVLTNNSSVNDFIVFDRNNRSKLQKNISKIKGFWSVRKAKFDLLIDLYNGGSSPFIVSISNARYRVGYDHQEDRKVYNLRSLGLADGDKKIYSFNEQSMSLLKPLSDKEFSLKPIFNVAENILESTPEYKNCYVLNLGAGSVDKLLENEKYLELVKYIDEEYNYRPLIVRNPGQEYLQEEFINSFLVPNNINYFKLNMLSLEELAGVIRKTDFIVTPDTGIMHLSFAQETFVYALFTYTNPDLVDIGSDKFVPVYEHFEPLSLAQKQTISISKLKESVDILFKKLNNEKQ